MALVGARQQNFVNLQIFVLKLVARTKNVIDTVVAVASFEFAFFAFLLFLYSFILVACVRCWQSK